MIKLWKDETILEVACKENRKINQRKQANNNS